MILLVGMASLLTSGLGALPTSVGAAATTLGAATGIVPPAPPTYIKGSLSWPVPSWMHTFLTGIVPFLPFIPYVGPAFFSLFSTFGANGANLLLTNSMGWALAKAGFNYACRGAYFFIALAFPGRWWLPYLKGMLYYANPWYVFDQIQRNSDLFATEGYKIPFANMYLNETIKARQDIMAWNAAERIKIMHGGKPDPLYPKCFAKPLTKEDIGFNEPEVDLSGNIQFDISGNTKFALDASGNRIACYGFMTPMKMGMMLMFIYPWLIEMSSLFPPEVQAIFDPWVSWGLTAVGGITALATTLTVGSIYAAPGAISTVVGLFPKMNGGGENPVKKQSGGIKLPSINDVIHNVLDNTKEMPELQEGGASSKETDESIMFLGSLTIVSLAGISLALIRSKNLSRTSI